MLERIERNRLALEAYENQDRVLRTVVAEKSLESLLVLREEMAREAASLLFQRLKAVPGSRELERLCSRRLAALAEVAALSIAIAKTAPGHTSPETTRRVCRLLLAEVEIAAAQVLPQDAVARLAEALQRRFNEQGGLDHAIGGC
jgi:hypothetical protein